MNLVEKIEEESEEKSQGGDFNGKTDLEPPYSPIDFYLPMDFEYQNVPTSDGRPLIELASDLIAKTKNQLTEEQNETLRGSLIYWMASKGEYENRKECKEDIQSCIKAYESLEKATPETLKAIKELGIKQFSSSNILKALTHPTSNNKTLVERTYNALTKAKEHLKEEQYEGLFQDVQSQLEHIDEYGNAGSVKQFYESLDKATPETLKAIKELGIKQFSSSNILKALTHPTSNNKTLAETAYNVLTKAKEHLKEEQYEVFKLVHTSYLNREKFMTKNIEEVVDIYEKLDKINFDSHFIDEICEGFYNGLIKLDSDRFLKESDLQLQSTPK